MFTSPLIERALNIAVDAHQGQTRKGGGPPYIIHPVHVAFILLKAGFTDENTLAAGLLHDVLEDTSVTAEELRKQFPDDVVNTVRESSEEKFDSQGKKRSWEVRKQDHLEKMREISTPARAVLLADKLHNLWTMTHDHSTDPEFWSRFNAPRERLVWYYDEVIKRCTTDDPRLQQMASECRHLLDQLR